MTERFEAAWARLERARRGRVRQLDRRARSPRWSSRACAARRVLCPSNTFMATPLAALHAGADVAFVDCNREDLCMSFADFEAQGRRATGRRRRSLVHIGGHIAFEVEAIAELCRAEGIFLIEDCAHAHGASWNGRRPGTWGDAGVWSFYATKTVSTGEGGMLVARRQRPARLRARLSQLRQARSRGGRAQLPAERVHRGARARADRAPGGDRGAGRTPPRARCWTRCTPAGCGCPTAWSPACTSTSSSTRSSARPGSVYDEPCHRLHGPPASDLPTTDWVAAHHWCVPLYYRPARERDRRLRDRLDAARRPRSARGCAAAPPPCARQQPGAL